MEKVIFLICFALLCGCNNKKETKEMPVHSTLIGIFGCSNSVNSEIKTEEQFCTNYSINEVFNDSILEYNLRLSLFNELPLDSIKGKGYQKFIRIFVFSFGDTSSILSYKETSSCTMVESKQAQTKYFNLINFEKGQEHDNYKTVEYSYKSKILYADSIDRFNKIINFTNELSKTPESQDFAIIEFYDGQNFKTLQMNNIEARNLTKNFLTFFFE